MKKRDDAPSDAALITRRDVLTMIGAGGLVLTLPVGSLAESMEAAMATPSTCPPQPPCPTSLPPTPGGLKVDKLPKLAQFIALLAQGNSEAQTNRRTFNNCPEKYFAFFPLSQADVAALIDFKDDPKDTIDYVKQQTQNPNDPPVKAQLQALESTASTFYKGWKWISPPDCYDGPSWCPSEMGAKYARPDARIIEVAPSKDASGITTLTVTAEGVVPGYYQMSVILDADGTDVPLESPFERDAASTFRCSKLVGKAKLNAGTRYAVKVVIGGKLLRLSQPFLGT